MTLVKAIEFETYTFDIDADGNRQLVEENWLVPDSIFAYEAIATKQNARAVHIAKYFDFDLPKKARIPSWLVHTMAANMIDDYKEELRHDYETDMCNGYGTIDAYNEMNGDY